MVHTNPTLGNILKAGFARKGGSAGKGGKGAKGQNDDERQFQQILRAIEAAHDKVKLQREKRARRRGEIIDEEKEEDFQVNQNQQEINPLEESDPGAEIVYDEELRGYFRKDALEKLKADPGYHLILKELEGTSEDKKESKKIKRKKAKEQAKENEKEKESQKMASKTQEADILDEGEGDQIELEPESLERETKEEKISRFDKKKTQKEGKLEQEDEKPSDSFSGLESEDDIFLELEEIRKKPAKKAVEKKKIESEDDIFQELEEFQEKPMKKAAEKKKIEESKIVDEEKKVVQKSEPVKKAEKPNPLLHNQFVVKVDPKAIQRALKIVKHEEKQKEHNKKSNAPQLYIDFKNTKEVSTFVNDQSIQVFSRTLKKLSPSSMTKLLKDSNFIDRDPVQNTLKMLLLITHIRRHALLKNYDRQDIRGHVEKMIENLPSLSPEIVTMLVYNLDKMRINEPEYFRKLETFIITHAAKFNLRCLSNIVYSFANTSLRQSVISDFSQLYKSLEIPISLRLKEKTPKDLAQIMTGYSKTQNFSGEFLQVMEKACFDARENLDTQELAVILHSFWKNNHKTEKLLEFASKSLFLIDLISFFV